MADPTSFIIVGEVDLDPDGSTPLPLPIGPFASRENANEFMESQLPLWGSWHVEGLTSPYAAALWSSR